MAAQIETSPPAVDDLKRRARRRLVGAVVLALAAAVILPLLLESDPKPLSDDVSIQIPPIDNGKFVTPLSPDKGPSPKPPTDRTDDTKAAATAADGATITVSPPSKRGLAEAEQHVLGQTAPPATPNTPETKAMQRVAPQPITDAQQPAPSSPPAAEVKSNPPVDAAPTVAAATPSLPTPSPAPPASAKAAAGGGFQVQLAAFTDAKAASELAKKVKAAGFAVHTEAVPTPQGPVERVRVGPFPTRAAADAAVTRLKSIGYGNPQVVAAK